MRSRTRPLCVSTSADAAAKKQPPGNTRRSTCEKKRSQSASSVPRAVCSPSVGRTTSSSKISPAASIVASWSSSFERKWA